MALGIVVGCLAYWSSKGLICALSWITCVKKGKFCPTCYVLRLCIWYRHWLATSTGIFDFLTSSGFPSVFAIKFSSAHHVWHMFLHGKPFLSHRHIATVKQSNAKDMHAMPAVFFNFTMSNWQLVGRTGRFSTRSRHTSHSHFFRSLPLF